MRCNFTGHLLKAQISTDKSFNNVKRLKIQNKVSINFGNNIIKLKTQKIFGKDLFNLKLKEILILSSLDEIISTA